MVSERYEQRVQPGRVPAVGPEPALAGNCQNPLIEIGYEAAHSGNQDGAARAPGPGAVVITRFRRSELARLALVPNPPDPSNRSTGVHERLPPALRGGATSDPADAIEDIHPSELEFTATLLELGALAIQPSAVYARESDARERAPHLYRHALKLARERGPYASTASIEGALAALRIVHGDPRVLARSVDRAREILASLHPTESDDASR